ncbi:MAG: anaerobic ribonucleoside-triphosphate reductase activating protein [Clostridia bacterium]|nr:anaerobic ribonucleoside-triphosphate reductase activating protein [Clostridia bacterium]
MLLKGLQKLTLLDYPGKMAATVFFGGCNFKCPFCHNASLVIGSRLKDTPTLPEEEFFDFLKKRQNLLEGVCVSGGEPTLCEELIPFLNKIKDMGFLVKLDTNGYRPDVLKEAVSLGLVDYVAMDIKNSKERYAETTGLSDIDIKKIVESVDFLMSGKVDFEFRTTLVRELHSERDIHSIGAWLRGDEKFFLQTFQDSGDLISSRLSGYDKNESEHLLNLLRVYIKNAQIRG